MQNKIKYGVSSQTAISICEKIFNDRVLAESISKIVQSNTVDTDNILSVIKDYEDDVFTLLNKYPEYFNDRLNYLLR